MMRHPRASALNAVFSSDLPLTLRLPFGKWLMAPNMMFPFHCTERGLVHIQSPELWYLHLPVHQISQLQMRNNSEVYHSEFEVVEPSKGHRWVIDASVHATNGLLNIPTVIQAHLLQCLHSLPPHITRRTWQDFEMFIKTLNERHVGCLYNSIIWRSNAASVGSRARSPMM